MRMLKIIVLLLSFLSFSAQGSSQASFPTYFKEVSSADGLPDNSVNVVTEDHYGSIWVGTWNGLARFDGRDVEVFRHSESDTTSLHNNMVRALYPYKGAYLLEVIMVWISIPSETADLCVVACRMARNPHRVR